MSCSRTRESLVLCVRTWNQSLTTSVTCNNHARQDNLATRPHPANPFRGDKIRGGGDGGRKRGVLGAVRGAGRIAVDDRGGRSLRGRIADGLAGRKAGTLLRRSDCAGHGHGGVSEGCRLSRQRSRSVGRHWMYGQSSQRPSQKGSASDPRRAADGEHDGGRIGGTDQRKAEPPAGRGTGGCAGLELHCPGRGAR